MTIVGTVNVGDDQVEAVAGWESVSLDMDSRLNFINAQRLATLKARVSGSGVVAADGSCGLVILGDNSSLSESGYFTFINSVVAVSNEFGLGSSATGTTHPLGASVKGAMIHFGPKSRLSFGLADRKAFTNHCAITYNCDLDVKTAVFGSEAVDERFVQDGDFLHCQVNSRRPLFFKNNFEMISGLFPLRTRRGNSLFVYCVDERAHVRFSGSAVIDASGGNESARDGVYWLGSGSVCFAQDGSPVLDVFADAGGRVEVDADGALDSVRQLIGYYEETSLADPRRYYDLNGNDLTVGTLTSAWMNEPSATSTGFHVIRSESPATVTIAGVGTMGFAAAHAFGFVGNVSVMMSDARSTNTFCTVVSESTGDLTVDAGTLEFKWGAGWSGTNVTVCGTGVLDVNSSRAFMNKVQSLVVSGGGKIVLRAGATANFATVRIGDVVLEPGVYTVSELKRMTGVAAHVDGEATATIGVGDVTEDWSGWPSEANATAVVPANATVYLHDADVARASGIARLVLRNDSTVVIDNASAKLTLGASVSGTGRIRIVDSCGVVLSGDNSGLVSPGGFFIDNSVIVVSNEFGLGGAATAAAEVRYTASSALSFECESGFFTNHVGIAYQGSGTSPCIRFGSESKDAFLVQDADFVHRSGGVGGQWLVLKNNVEFKSGTLGSTSSSLYVTATEDTSVIVSEDCTVAFLGNAKASFRLYGPGWDTGTGIVTWRWNPKAIAGYEELSVEVANLVCERENAFPAGFPVSIVRINPIQKGRGRLDLNGLNQSLSLCGDSEATAESASSALVTSGSPAVLESTMPGDRREALRFEGCAGYRYAGAGTNRLAGTVSTSTGSFEVASGVSGFDWGATWGGTNITVGKEGVLFVGVTSAEAGVFGTAKGSTKSAAVLRVDGSLELEGGTTAVFNAFRADVQLDRGVYCAAENAEARSGGAIGVGWIVGSGVLRVLEGPRRGLCIVIR